VSLEWKGGAGRIDESLYSAATMAGVPDRIISELVDIFGAQIDFFSDLQPGDTFKVIYEEYERDRSPVDVGDVLAAEIVNAGKRFTAFYFDDQDGRRGYRDSQGKAVGGNFLRYPLEFTRISSVFTQARFHPILKVRRPHLGVDFAAPVGTPVRAVAPGKVLRAGYGSDVGYHVKIEHRRPFATSYSHLRRIAAGITPGTAVQVGQVIGFVGSTGWSTGPHLHYALYRGRRYINPLSVNNSLLVGGEAGAGSTRVERRPKKWPAGASLAMVKDRLKGYLASMDGEPKPVLVSLAVPKSVPVASAQGG